MSRRGLVSKSFGPSGGSPGGAALVPKGEGGPAPSSGYLTVEEVAATLRVTPAQVNEWIRKDTLRGNDSGIKQYDLKKFQYDSREEIARAQTQALKESQKSIEKSHQKSGGFFSKLFGKGKSAESTPGNDAALARENRKLKEELQRAKTEAKDESATSRLEEKVRYLEDKLSRSSGLEGELADLRRRLAQAENAAPAPAAHHQDLESQLEETRRELAEVQEAARLGETARQELLLLQEERTRLEAELARLQEWASPSPAEAPANEELEQELEAARAALAEMDRRLEAERAENEQRRHELQADISDRERTIGELEAELSRSRQEPQQLPTAMTTPDPTPLLQELLSLQEANLARFRRLKDLKDLAEQRLSQGVSETVSDTGDAGMAKLQAEFETLRVKHQSLLEARETNTSGHQEFVEQLAAARVTTTRLRQENTALKARLDEADVDGWKSKVDELQRRLREASGTDPGMEQMELELRATRKSLQAREAQVQKIAGRVQENERALKKALKESTRLTELLIERENRLRDLSTEYEQEYRDKLDSQDRQVSSLQWKLSLRDERIASLESEVGELRKQVGRE